MTGWYKKIKHTPRGSPPDTSFSSFTSSSAVCCQHASASVSSTHCPAYTARNDSTAVGDHVKCEFHARNAKLILCSSVYYIINLKKTEVEGELQSIGLQQSHCTCKRANIRPALAAHFCWFRCPHTASTFLLIIAQYTHLGFTLSFRMLIISQV